MQTLIDRYNKCLMGRHYAGDTAAADVNHVGEQTRIDTATAYLQLLHVQYQVVGEPGGQHIQILSVPRPATLYSVEQVLAAEATRTDVSCQWIIIAVGIDDIPAPISPQAYRAVVDFAAAYGITIPDCVSDMNTDGLLDYIYCNLYGPILRIQRLKYDTAMLPWSFDKMVKIVKHYGRTGRAEPSYYASNRDIREKYESIKNIVGGGCTNKKE